MGLLTDDLRFKHEGDQVVNSGNIRKFTPDLNAGVYFYASSFFIGASVNQVLNSKLSFAEEYNTGKEEPHYFINTGFRVWFGEDISVAPSVMLKYVNPLPGSYDLNMKVAYRSDVWLGFSWRKKDSVAGMLGFSVSKMVSAGYSYDYTLSNLRNSSSGSHEVVLGLNF